MNSASRSTDQIIDHVGSDHLRIEKRDRRRYPYPMVATLRFAAPPGGVETVVQVQAIDLSQGGIRIRSRGMFHVGAEGTIELTRSDGSCTLVGVKVCHCKYVGNMQHETGLQFIRRERTTPVKGITQNRRTA